MKPTAKKSSRVEKRNNFVKSATGVQKDLPNLGPLDRGAILRHLIEKVRKKHGHRYAAVLSMGDLDSILETSLNPAVRGICEEGKFTLPEYPDHTPLEGLFMLRHWTGYALLVKTLQQPNKPAYTSQCE